MSYSFYFYLIIGRAVVLRLTVNIVANTIICDTSNCSNYSVQWGNMHKSIFLVYEHSL